MTHTTDTPLQPARGIAWAMLLSLPLWALLLALLVVLCRWGG